MIGTETKTGGANFARNTGLCPLTLIDLEGAAHVFTPGLSVCGDIDATILESFAEFADGVDILSVSSLKALSVASFKKLVTGQITIEALKVLLTADLKAGQSAAVREVTASEGIAA